jgi:hypothetical protein
MTTSGTVNATQLLSLDRALRYAVIQSWDELMPQGAAGSIQIEYQNVADNELQYLKLWKSTELGHWDMIAEFWEKPLWGNAAGLRMVKEYLQSAGAVWILEFVLAHQANFTSLAGTTGVLQIFSPTPGEREEAAAWVHVAGGDAGGTPVTPIAA